MLLGVGVPLEREEKEGHTPKKTLFYRHWLL